MTHTGVGLDSTLMTTGISYVTGPDGDRNGRSISKVDDEKDNNRQHRSEAAENSEQNNIHLESVSKQIGNDWIWEEEPGDNSGGTKMIAPFPNLYFFPLYRDVANFVLSWTRPQKCSFVSHFLTFPLGILYILWVLVPEENLEEWCVHQCSMLWWLCLGLTGMTLLTPVYKKACHLLSTKRVVHPRPCYASLSLFRSSIDLCCLE
jgi:hypothetical protein